MASTRFNSDESRQIKLNQEATDIGRYMLNVPGLGLTPSYVADPHIRAQKWAGNLCSNPIGIESTLFGIDYSLTKGDCIDRHQLPLNQFHIGNQYPTNGSVFTDETRATHPAWTYRDKQQYEFQPLFENPQLNIYQPFEKNNINSRNLAKDSFCYK